MLLEQHPFGSAVAVFNRLEIRLHDEPLQGHGLNILSSGAEFRGPSVNNRVSSSSHAESKHQLLIQDLDHLRGVHIGKNLLTQRFFRSGGEPFDGGPFAGLECAHFRLLTGARP